ncbi:NucA/NucB deoxyribonuclease domain-containing protein [Streptomyces violascens]|uniref:NucA/NucB deoxyribonuclease domain-containing protein n=1 Tax=Streptomyces violascens TaxID=67381 RepID=UPI00368836B8
MIHQARWASVARARAHSSYSDPIRRLYFDQTRRDRNRDTAVAVCRKEWPGYPELGQDCDEFPFASTYEGAARSRPEYDGTPYGMFSVRAINSPDNQEAGRRLGTWYGDDRIIDADPFFLRITQ